MDSKGTVLLVEDQEGFRRIYQDVLNAEGYFVLSATDGEAGWEMAKQKKPDLVLLDLGLPKIDGFEVLRRIREDPETKKMPVIIFSVMGEQKEIQKAMEMGANDYTVKGFYTPRQILSKIKSVLTQGDVKKGFTAYKLLVKPGREDSVKLQDEIGLTNGYECPECRIELLLEMFPDYVREGGHWFSSRLICPKCGKVA
jgi:DNA-binding response OmpR family regulator